VRKRLYAKKGLRLSPPVAEAKGVPVRIAEFAKEFKESNEAILLYIRSPEDAKVIRDKLRALYPKEQGREPPIRLLTGTIRGFERDRLVSTDGVYARFLAGHKGEKEPGTAYLIATSAGEVGINLDGDHLICDLTTLDSMAQRFGRVNRFGEGD